MNTRNIARIANVVTICLTLHYDVVAGLYEPVGMGFICVIAASCIQARCKNTKASYWRYYSHLWSCEWIAWYAHSIRSAPAQSQYSRTLATTSCFQLSFCFNCFTKHKNISLKKVLFHMNEYVLSFCTPSIMYEHNLFIQKICLQHLKF